MLKSQGKHREFCLDRSVATQNIPNLKHSNVYKNEHKWMPHNLASNMIHCTEKLIVFVRSLRENYCDTRASYFPLLAIIVALWPKTVLRRRLECFRSNSVDNCLSNIIYLKIWESVRLSFGPSLSTTQTWTLSNQSEAEINDTTGLTTTPNEVGDTS